MSNKPIKIGSKELSLMKSVTGADYSSKTVLTDSVWEFVELWLRRQKSVRSGNSDSLFYWRQARNFYDAAESLPIESRPLCSYYCCLNATKALLSVKGSKDINFDSISHGISSNMRQAKNVNIINAEVTFQGKGVLFELSKYLEEDINKREYSIYDILYNIPCIHRAFSITYNCPELFIPVSDLTFIANTDIKQGWLQFKVDTHYSNKNAIKNVPSRYEKIQDDTENNYIMRSRNRFSWDIHTDIKQRKNGLSQFHKKLRKDFHYINGNVTLWYLKKQISTSTHIINRNSLTLIFAVMHWLSELVRYNPKQFENMMGTKQNWIINEFIDKALQQFIDEISCEITGANIMTTGFRNPR